MNSQEKTNLICKILSDRKAEHLEEKLKKEYETVPRRVEGVQGGRWAVLDYADVIVHIFGDEERDFYRLERLWEDGANLTRFAD